MITLSKTVYRIETAVLLTLSCRRTPPTWRLSGGPLLHLTLPNSELIPWYQNTRDGPSYNPPTLTMRVRLTGKALI